MPCCSAVRPGAADSAEPVRSPDCAAPAEQAPPERKPQCDAPRRDRTRHSSDVVRQTNKPRSSRERTDCVASSVSQETPAIEPQPNSEARLRLLKPSTWRHNDVARSSFRRTDRYPHTYWRNFCVVGTEPFELVGDVAVAGQGREDVQAQHHGRRYCWAFGAVCRAQAQGGDPDRPKLSDHHAPGGGVLWVLAPPRSATGGDREPRGRSGLDRDAAAAQAGQDGQARWRGTVAGASRLQARRATGVRDGGRALA